MMIRPALLSALLALFASGLSLAQQELDSEGSQAEETVYVETVDVSLVNVDVIVTDKKGNIVTGLKREDFEILEDDRPMAITNFYAVEAGVRQDLETIETPAEAAPSAVPGVEEKPVISEDQRLHLVVYVDNFNIRPFNRNRVFRRLREFLNDQLGPEDRVMLVSYDRSIHIRHNFTTDPTLVSSATFDLEKMTGYGVHRDSERRDLLRDIEEAENVSEVMWRIRQYAESGYNDLSFTIDALKEIVDSLGGLPGRKAIVYVSDGLPMTPGEDLYYAITQKFHENTVLTQAREFDAHRQYRELIARANTNRVSFYTIDAAGLRAPEASNVQYQTANTPGLGSFVDSVNISNLQGSLILMAEETGGQAIYNTNDVGPRLASIAEDFRTYYSIGYTPSHSGTGRYYKIKVKVSGRKDLRVRHRAGYRDQPLLTRMADGARSSLMYGYENNPLELELRFGEPKRSEKGLFDVPILVGIPIGKVVLIPQAEIHEARVKLYFGAMDTDGDMSDVQEVDVPIRIPKEKLEEALTGYFPFQSQLRMRAGAHRVAVGVWDEVAAVSSFISKPIVVGQ